MRTGAKEATMEGMHWDSEWPHTVDELMKRDDLTHGLKAKILGQNALTFYGMTTPAGAR